VGAVLETELPVEEEPEEGDKEGQLESEGTEEAAGGEEAAQEIVGIGEGIGEIRAESECGPEGGDDGIEEAVEGEIDEGIDGGGVLGEDENKEECQEEEGQPGVEEALGGRGSFRERGRTECIEESADGAQQQESGQVQRRGAELQIGHDSKNDKGKDDQGVHAVNLGIILGDVGGKGFGVRPRSDISTAQAGHIYAKYLYNYSCILQ